MPDRDPDAMRAGWQAAQAATAHMAEAKGQYDHEDYENRELQLASVIATELERSWAERNGHDQ
jgi:hypothetical protein